MSDSWGNTPEGILTGHLGAFGDFDECIGIKATNLTVYNKMFPGISKSFEGRYCTSIILDHGSAMAALEGDTGIYIAEEGEEEVEHNVRVNRAVSVEEFLVSCLLQRLIVYSGKQAIEPRGLDSRIKLCTSILC